MYKLISLLAAAFFCFILWIIYLANTGGHSVFFDFIRSLPYGDKLGHFCLFGLLTLILVVGSKFCSFRLGRIRIYYGVLAVTVFVVGEELSQAFIPTRTFDLIDLAADALGISLATTIAFVINKYLAKQFNPNAANNPV
jgi:hypothetical protein